MLTDLAFDQPRYRDITRARLDHLASLGLDVSKRTVLDVGSGIGRLAEFFRDRGCRVTCIDGRASNIATLRQLYPDIDARLMDLEGADLDDLPQYDIVFCYGIVYHLVDPLRAIGRLARHCSGMMLIESRITDSSSAVVKIVHEEGGSSSQGALYGLGSRPTGAYLEASLRIAGFDHIYAPNELPNDPEYRYEDLDDGADLRSGQLMRKIVIGSRGALESLRIHATSVGR